MLPLINYTLFGNTMIKLTVNDKVLKKLTEAFPKPQNSAKRALSKYISVLEEKLTESLNHDQTQWQKKFKLHSIAVKKLSNNGGQIGPNRVRLHAWLERNGLSLIQMVKPGSNRSGVVSLVKLTDLVTMTDSMGAEHLSTKTDAQLDNYLNDSLESDKDFIRKLLPDLASFSDEQIADQYDTTEIDIKSLKGYIKWLVTKANKLSALQKRENLRHAQIILRVAQFYGGVFYQKKKLSTFGRMYYSGISVQSVHKSLREAMLGDCYEYDINSSVIAWKIGFAQMCYDAMKSRKSFDKEFSAMLFYLGNKKEFTADVIRDTFTSDSNSSKENQVKLIKTAFTALSFGARLTVKGWHDDSGNFINPAIVEIIKNNVERGRFAQCYMVKKFISEQKVLDNYIFSAVSTNRPDLLKLKELQTRSGRASKSKVVAYWYQHAETEVMDVVRVELKTLGKTVLASIHDAIIVRNRLSYDDKIDIERKMCEATVNDYWKLGEKKIKRYQVVSAEVLEEERLHKQRMIEEAERAKNYIPKSF